MAFSRLKSDLNARVGVGFQNLVFTFQKLVKDGDDDILIGERYPDRTPLKVRLSKTRSWRDRASLAETFADIQPGSGIVLYEAEIVDGVADVRRVMPVTKTSKDPGKAVSGAFARVGEPQLMGEDWVQAVQVVHAGEAVLCASREETVNGILAALNRSDIGSPSFAIRAVDEEGVAIAVRFQRLWNTEKMCLAPAEESFAAFLESEVMIQGLSNKVLGSEFLDILEAQKSIQWEVIPITTFNMRGEQVKAAGEGRGRNRAAPYRYNFVRPETGTGFVPSVVAIDKTVGYYCKDSIPVAGGIAPVALPYVPSCNLQPAAQAEVVIAAEEKPKQEASAPTAAVKPESEKAERKASRKAKSAPEKTAVAEEVAVEEVAPELPADEPALEEVELEAQEAADAEAAVVSEAEPVSLNDEEVAALGEAFVTGEDFAVDIGDLDAELNGLGLEPLTELGDEPLLAPAAL